MVNAMTNQPARPDPARPARRGVLARTLPRPQRQTPPKARMPKAAMLALAPVAAAQPPAPEANTCPYREATPPAVEAVDATGAGDAFVAAITVALLEGMNPSEALRFACAAGAFAATRPGAQPSAPERDQVERLLKG